jgi:hypothetical protein
MFLIPGGVMMSDGNSKYNQKIDKDDLIALASYQGQIGNG